MYEEKLSVLLRSKQKYARQSQESATTCDTILQEASDRMEKLREELDSMKEANRVLTKQLAEANANNFGRRRTRNSSKAQPVPMVEYDEEDEEDEAEDERDSGDDSDLERDPDFRGTPLSKRKKSTSVRESMLNKKKKSTGSSVTTTSADQPASGDADRSGSAPHCTCTTGCSTKRCGCKKLGEFCGESCRCSDTCRNRRLDVLPDDDGDDGEDAEEEPVDEKKPPKKEEVEEEDNKENVARNSVKEKRKSQDDSDEGTASDQSPKRAKIDLLTPTYVYSVKKRKPLLDDL